MWIDVSHGYPHDIRPTPKPQREGAVTEQSYRAADRLLPFQRTRAHCLRWQSG